MLKRDCFYEGEYMLVINPEECIDCSLCEPECPLNAILPETDHRGMPNPDATKWLEFNRKYSTEMMWPVITENGDPDPEYEKYDPVNFPDGKMHLFSEKPGEGS